MKNLLTGYGTSGNPGTDRIAAAFERILVGTLVCLICGSALGQVRMAIEVTPNNPQPGERVVVRVTVTNAGSASVDDLQAQVDYPTGLADMDDDFFSDGGDCTDLAARYVRRWRDGILEYRLAAAGAGKTVYMSPRIDTNATNGLMIPFDGRVVEGAAVLATAQSDAMVEENRSLELEIDADREPVAPGETLRYELSFGNQSGTATTDTELRFPLPAGTSLVEASDGGTLVGNEVVWDLGTLNPGDSRQAPGDGAAWWSCRQW